MVAGLGEIDSMHSQSRHKPAGSALVPSSHNETDKTLLRLRFGQMAKALVV